MDGFNVDGIIIRRATLADVDEIGRLWEKLVQYHQQINPALPRATLNGGRIYSRNLASRLNDTHTRVFVADQDGRIVGYVLGVVVDLVPEMFEQESSGFLADIFVEEAFRRLGVGRALVTTLQAWFREHKLKYFEWHVAYENREGLAFWQAIQGEKLMIRMRAEIEGEHD